jgi:hypothetical protein
MRDPRTPIAYRCILIFGEIAFSDCGERDLGLLALLHSIRQSSIISNIKCSIIMGTIPDDSGYYKDD